MKALSIKNPYATLIYQGEKTIEVRSWPTHFRGELLICSTARPSNQIARDLKLVPDGVMVCIARLIDCRPFVASDVPDALVPWVPGHYAWVLGSVRHSCWRPVKGRLGLFDVENGRIERLSELTTEIDPRSLTAGNYPLTPPFTTIDGRLARTPFQVPPRLDPDASRPSIAVRKTRTLIVTETTETVVQGTEVAAA